METNKCSICTKNDKGKIYDCLYGHMVSQRTEFIAKETHTARINIRKYEIYNQLSSFICDNCYTKYMILKIFYIFLSLVFLSLLILSRNYTLFIPGGYIEKNFNLLLSILYLGLWFFVVFILFCINAFLIIEMFLSVFRYKSIGTEIIYSRHKKELIKKWGKRRECHNYDSGEHSVSRYKLLSFSPKNIEILSNDGNVFKYRVPLNLSD